MKLFKTKHLLVYTLTVCTLILSIPLHTKAQITQPVNIPDPDLRAVIEVALRKDPGVIITEIDMATLTHLDANDKEIQDLTGLQFAKNLQELHLYGNIISDLQPLAGLIQLKVLNLASNVVSDLIPLTGLTRLESLHIGDNIVEDLSPLADLIKLVSLNIGANLISDLSSVSQLKNLITFFAPSNFISDISALTGLKKLRDMRFNNNEISDLSPLSGLTRLHILALGQNPISDLTPLSELIMLRVLGLSSTLVNDFTPLSGLVKLEELSAERTAISSLSGLEGLVSLQNLYIKGCSVANLSPLTELQHLRYLYLQDNLITDLSPLAGLTKLEEVYLAGNPVTDFTPLLDLPSLMIGIPTGLVFLASTTQVTVGDTFTVHIRAQNIVDLAAWQFNIKFDPAAIKAAEVNEGDFLKGDGVETLFQEGTIDNESGTISGVLAIRLAEGRVNGNGMLVSVTFSARAVGRSRLTLENVQLSNSFAKSITLSSNITEIFIDVDGSPDVNQDGRVDILDLVAVVNHIGERNPTNWRVDVNGDGVVSILDLVLVAQHLGESNSADAPNRAALQVGVDTAMLQTWIALAQAENDGSIAFQLGIKNLERLLVSLIPDKTALLANYPNPFNPETWIPYQLSEPAEVTLTIYATNGALVRTLALGHQPAGIYQSRAAYWDGRNQVGEFVASGVYFYTLSAGDFTATRKMLIRK